MMIAIDGACKRNGKPDCLSAGVAWIQDGDKLLYSAKVEQNSTSQRGEINGLIEALKYFAKNGRQCESLILITDSEYLHNTVTFEWCFKWKRNGWLLASGDPAKNIDLWTVVCDLLTEIDSSRVLLNWTKGHLLPYSEGLIKRAMITDTSGVELYSRLLSIAERPSEHERLANDFNANRIKNNYMKFPIELAVETVVFNTVADCIASFTVKLMDDVMSDEPTNI